MFHMTHSVDHNYVAAFSSAVIFNTQGNLWGFLVENNDASNPVYLQFFDSNSGAVGNPVFTIRIPVGSAFGKDVDEVAAYHFDNGCFVRAVDARGGTTLSVTAPTVQFWYSNK
jgi:hypothetical protein